MGKTHILNAIGLELKKVQVMFILEKDLCINLLNLLSQIAKLKENFRNTDILLIDDIQS